MFANLPLHTQKLTSQNSVSTAGSLSDLQGAQKSFYQKINKSSSSEGEYPQRSDYSAYLSQNSYSLKASQSLPAKAGKKKRSYYWKINELAVLFMVRFQLFSDTYESLKFKLNFKI